MLLRGASFIVTGGSSGLGAAAARMLVEAGARVTIADLNVEAGQETIREFGSDARFVKADVTDGEEGAAVIAAALEAFGGLRGLVNCAGVAPAEKVLGRDGPHRLESFARTVGINLIGTFNMIRLAASAIQNAEPDAEGERGVIVNTASVAAFDGQIGQAAYAASKGGGGGDDAADRPRACPPRHSRRVDRARHLRNTDDGWYADGSAGSARQERAVPAAARPAGGICDSGAPYLGKQHAERRGHPPRRGIADGRTLSVLP